MANTNIHWAWKDRLTTPPYNWQTGSFVNARGQALPYGLSLPSRKIAGHVMYVEGLNEPIQKTYELARNFNRHALAFSVFDRMGQGLGGRFLQNKFKIHSQGFTHDVADLIQFVENVIPHGQKVTMLAHSTGGLIALMAYHDRPDLFMPPLLTAPLMGFKNEILQGREDIFSRMQMPGWMQEMYIPGGKDWRLRGTEGLLPQNAYSSHPERMKLHDFFPEKNAALRGGDITLGWIWRACQAMTMARSPEWLAKLGPLTIVTAGKEIQIDNEPTLKALPHIRQATHIHIEQAKHEIPFEEDRFRSRIINETVKLALKGQP